LSGSGVGGVGGWVKEENEGVEKISRPRDGEGVVGNSQITREWQPLLY